MSTGAAEPGLSGLIVAHLDDSWGQYRERLDGLTDPEHLWAPVPRACGVHRDGDRWTIDHFDRHSAEPVITSVAWRMWHVAIDCLESYSQRAFGVRGTALGDADWVGSAEEAIAASDDAWRCFRDEVAALDAAGLAQPLGASFGFFAERPYAALALHAGREVAHHGAEVALLRDLYAAQATY